MIRKLMSSAVLSFAMLSMTLVATSANASIFFETVNLSGSTWENTYTVKNDTLLADITGFTIYFDAALYQNLVLTTPVVDWDELVIDPAFPFEGLFDAGTVVTGIAPGDSLGGFSLTFEFLGAGTPGSQPYEIYDFDTFDVLDGGDTQLLANGSGGASAVPEPATLLLLSTGLLGAARLKRKQ